ncbi:Ig-like domain-containing protein [Candidatus Palauibacter sp.]|uniref:Ig-like domain-containing protein n=1 Tax=Candidatus Palauibacter sp. TaxID=3101350 RepID=UPI003B01090B
MPRHGRVRSALPLMLIGAAALAAACGGGDTVDPGPMPPPPPPPPPPPANRAPVAGTAIPDQMVVEGQTVAVDISASFSDPDGDTLTYVATTSNAGVVSVGLSGRTLTLTAVADGAAAVTVRASDPGGLSASQSFAVEVAEPAPTTLTVTPDTATLAAIGRTVQLSADVRDQLGRPMTDAAVAWSSGDTAVATVDTSGLVTAVANGAATITALSGEASDSASIAVSQTAAAVEITPTTHTLVTGDTVRLAATATDGNGHPVADAVFSWTSSDTTIASVDSLGLVRGVAEGTATITAAVGDAAAAVEGTAEITVLPPPPPPDLTGTYLLESLVGTSTGGTLLTHPTVSGTLELAQEAPSGDSATGSYEVSITTPGRMIADEGAFTVRTGGSWRQTGDVSGEGTYAISGDTLTLAITEPGTAASTAVWVMGTPPPPPAPGTWRGLVVAPESRCSEYNVEHYRHPAGLEDAVVAALGDKLYEAYTGVYHDHAREVQVDHIVAKREAHDSGGCAWPPSTRRAFARDLENLALASRTLDLGVKAGRDAAEWLPDFNRCWYAGAVVAVRLKYELTVDEAERDALEEVLSGCDSTELVLTAESWTTEAITLGDESGWQALSPHEPDLNGLGVASYMAVFCTSAFASVDFAFVAGGARLDGSFEDYESGRLGYTSRVNTEWSTPPPRTLERITAHQYPHWETWTARIGRVTRDAFIDGLVQDRQRVFVTWLLNDNDASVAYEGGADARENILDILQRCTGGEGDLTTLLSGLSGSPTALRGRRP